MECVSERLMRSLMTVINFVRNDMILAGSFDFDIESRLLISANFLVRRTLVFPYAVMSQHFVSLLQEIVLGMTDIFW